ncbi:hypothetical protein Dimus_015717 [Dionaea muscipula]
MSWTLDGLFTSQLGDIETIIIAPGFSGSVKEYLKVQYGGINHNARRSRKEQWKQNLLGNFSSYVEQLIFHATWFICTVERMLIMRRSDLYQQLSGFIMLRLQILLGLLLDRQASIGYFLVSFIKKVHQGNQFSALVTLRRTILLIP